jgi:phospholipid transport system substrate-binding protein
MVAIIRSNQELFVKDPELFKDKINIIFEPMVDFRRVGASVMGRKYYFAANEDQRLRFIEIFKKSLLDNYASTLAQWGDQRIETIFPEIYEYKKTDTVHQFLHTASQKYPIKYTVRDNGKGAWLIINISVNGVNLGKNFRNAFQALAGKFDGDIEKVIINWSSNADIE